MNTPKGTPYRHGIPFFTAEQLKKQPTGLLQKLLSMSRLARERLAYARFDMCSDPCRCVFSEREHTEEEKADIRAMDWYKSALKRELDSRGEPYKRVKRKKTDKGHGKLKGQAKKRKAAQAEKEAAAKKAAEERRLWWENRKNLGRKYRRTVR